MRQTDEQIKIDGWEKGYTGFPSSDNPHPVGTSEHEMWAARHREGYWAAVDEGQLENTL